MKAKAWLDNAFMAGLIAIALDVALYAFDLPHAGVAFCAGLFVCLGSCLLSILLGEKAKREDFVILAVGIVALTWLAAKNI